MLRNSNKFKRHGLSHSPVYYTWVSMISRCERPLQDMYPYYGGRGIQVCKRWHVFSNFLADMGERPVGCTLDRIDPNGNYSKHNCRWATLKEQQWNRRNNRVLAYNGVSQAMSAWAEQLGIKYSTFKMRVYSGWPVEKIIEFSKRKYEKVLTTNQ